MSGRHQSYLWKRFFSITIYRTLKFCNALQHVNELFLSVTYNINEKTIIASKSYRKELGMNIWHIQWKTFSFGSKWLKWFVFFLKIMNYTVCRFYRTWQTNFHTWYTGASSLSSQHIHKYTHKQFQACVFITFPCFVYMQYTATSNHSVEFVVLTCTCIHE